jgi:hypothetical protein
MDPAMTQTHEAPPSVRILPMSSKVPGFHNRTIEEVQQIYFLNKLPKNKGRFSYPSTGLKAPPGTIVLFQFQAHIIATAIFERDEKFPRPKNTHAGILHFDPRSFQTFDPLDINAMRKAWPRFHAFGHAKQKLNPECYPELCRLLQNARIPSP